MVVAEIRMRGFSFYLLSGKYKKERKRAVKKGKGEGSCQERISPIPSKTRERSYKKEIHESVRGKVNERRRRLDGLGQKSKMS